MRRCSIQFNRSRLLDSWRCFNSIPNEIYTVQIMTKNLNELISYSLNSMSEDNTDMVSKVDQSKFESFLRGYLLKLNILLVVAVRPLCPSIENYLRKKLSQFINYDKNEDKFFIQILPSVSNNKIY